MIKIEIGKNEKEQRLDRFLRKYLPAASLSQIYKLIRKDIKVNGKRQRPETILREGDFLNLYIPEEKHISLSKKDKRPMVKKQFNVVYEDENILIVEKPYGLLTHGDKKEKKNHLTNQVISYLIEKGDYNPRLEKTFVPAPVNRLDRNTAGLVVFGKTGEALKLLSKAVGNKNSIRKFYLTIVEGKLSQELHLKSNVVKDGEKNKLIILKDNENGKFMETIATPIKDNGRYTLVQVEILTGRTHQIRAHLSDAGYPIIGDSKYGGRKIANIDAGTQILFAYKLQFVSLDRELAYLNDKVIEIKPSERFEKIRKDFFD